MNWRVFQVAFIFGVVLAAYSQSQGAMGFRTAADLLAGGIIMGILVEGAWAMRRAAKTALESHD